MKKGQVMFRIRKLPDFDASRILGAPFAVILHDAVDEKYSDTGEIVSHVIPNVRGLIASAAVMRACSDQKLNGAEIKFLRKTLAQKAKDFAGNVGITPEQLSRYENDRTPISPMYERIVRMAVCIGHLEAARALGIDLKGLLTLKIRSVRICSKPLEFHFHLATVPSDSAGHADESTAIDGHSWREAS